MNAESLKALLLRCQEFIGTETSVEAQAPHFVYGAPKGKTKSAAERLREEADKADRKDRLIADVRHFLDQKEPTPYGMVSNESAVYGPAEGVPE